MEGRTPPTGLETVDLAAKIEEVRKSEIFASRSSSLPTWCPGCGYFGITRALTGAIHNAGLGSEDVVFVSGIGCAGRFPYFMKTYGFHTVHGRALPVATGVQMGNPELTVIAVGGDGDGVGIGGGHLPHAIRRNVDMVYILFDNSIYGLTKGQVSPTSPENTVTKTSPYGSVDAPLDPLIMALSDGATFAGRGFAGDVDGMEKLFREAIAYDGFAFIHLLTTCVTFDKVNATWDNLWERTSVLPAEYGADDRQAAMNRALENSYELGIFYREERDPLHVRSADIIRKSKGG